MRTFFSTGYIATAKTFNETAGLKPDDPGSLPEDSTNIFLVVNHGSMSGETTYCMLIMTEEGTYLIGRPYATDQYEGAWVSGMYSSLDANSYKENLVFYSPTTLSEQLDRQQFIEYDLLDILQSMTKVTAANVDTIPFPDPATFSAENPETFLLIPLLYDAPALPQDFDPAELKAAPDSLGSTGSGTSDADDPLYYLPCFSIFTAASPDEIAGHDMVSGTLEINDNLLSSGPVGTYFWVPELDDSIGISWLSEEGNTLKGVYTWKVPEGSEFDFVSWVDNGTTIATGASITNLSDPSMVVPIDEVFFSPGRTYSQFTYFTPAYDFKIGITELVPYPGKYGFIDVPASAWYSSVVAQANRYGYMTGWGTWYFGPEKTLSRAMAATVVYRLAGAPGLGDEAQQVFPDVPTDAWYSYPVYWASENGIMGLNTSSLSPQGSILRCEAAAMSVRAHLAGIN